MALLHPNEAKQLEKVNPFLRAFHTSELKPGIILERIRQGTGWGTTTFYSKMRRLGLTEQEANVVATVLNIPIEEMQSWEGFFKN